ncbi:MAG TPA: hypothetical protein VKR31_16375 [Rhizomicrobium sp.]|nr:hypothetical protein [Rhizomicrobium sp.]
MHFHLPKPLHGWRAIFGEVGFIVFGVLIALGAWRSGAVPGGADRPGAGARLKGSTIRAGGEGQPAHLTRSRLLWREAFGASALMQGVDKTAR